ncbi:MAG: UDP-4-amino-4,6-dideoxy-N-acetyl-beta-L-altrosamine transaminase [Firmicutes bacterium HGW-Firmicutes-1]|jgi:UDP-4-amino-4,6-dideoxy-N-acetyl-beta-L-altrosamine transaminase|nr:MAG: UDP-4-amino-4,6-dideoxy-N-acetyl-beta-L-altrosamine transaminase [Firmicutes bacterium HGW-Firmicutes-1]
MLNDKESQLAIHKGRPVRDSLLPYGKQYIDDDDIAAVVATLKSDFVTCGPMVDAFEKNLAQSVGTKFAVAVSNGTAALHAACFAAGITEGDEVITTPMTFAASANCILYCGGTPVFADIDPKTWNINPKEIEKKITSKTKAIIPVDYTGMPVDIDAINLIAQKHNLIVIQDSAHSLGASYKGKRVGSLTDMSEFSFHPVKHITTGEGGAVVTDNEELYKKLLLFRTHGITRDLTLLEDHTQSSWYYEQQHLGYNYRITDIQCALGNSQLGKLDDFVKRRREIVHKYRLAYSKIKEITLQDIPDYCDSSWHLFVIKLNIKMLNASRNDIFDALRAENIGVNMHYIPVYLHPYYSKLGYEKGLCPNAEELYEGIISLPLFPTMKDEDVEDVMKAVKKVIHFYRKKI